MRILAFAASVRTGSHNRKLVELIARLARAEGAEVDLAAFREFDMPLYDGDLNAASGLPPGALELGRRLDAADALVVVTPEYNYSIPGTLKNAIDWVSRARPMPWRGKPTFLAAASPGAIGGIRGLWQTRIPLEGCGALVYPDMFALSHAAEAFDDAGDLRDPELGRRLRGQLAGFLRLARVVAAVLAPDLPDDERERRLALVSALAKPDKDARPAG